MKIFKHIKNRIEFFMVKLKTNNIRFLKNQKQIKIFFSHKNIKILHIVIVI